MLKITYNDIFWVSLTMIVSLTLIYIIFFVYVPKQNRKNEQKAAAQAERERQEYTDYLFDELPGVRYNRQERDYEDFIDTEVMG